MSREYQTTDVDLAAFLVCRQQDVLRVDPPSEQPWLAAFVFEQTDALSLVVEEWENGERAVDALEFSKRRVRLYRWARSVLDAVRPDHERRGRLR